ncbi:MAG: hypothetical protein KUF75_07825 [Candidatus Thiodiazotropha sp. (ex Ctena orbiculata)]|nr:hypothetical protein [Candidatus Thiodiazotropha taylori]
MYIKSYADLANHPHGDRVKKALNRHIFKKKFKACVFLPSHILDTAKFCNEFQRQDLWNVSEKLNRYSPYETELLLSAIDACDDVEKLKRVHDAIRNANRLTGRFIQIELQKIERESPVVSAIKSIFSKGVSHNA